MTLSVAQLTPIQRTLGGNQAETVVLDRYSFAQQYAENAFREVQDYLEYLKNVFNAGFPEMPDIDYQRLDPPDIPNLLGTPPEPPTDEEMTPTPIDLPPEPTLRDVDLPALTMDLPSAPDDPEGADFVYNEGVYYSVLDEAVRDGLLDYIQNGGTGLDADVEEEIWNRALARMETENERAYAETQDFYASRGYNLPPGAVSGRLLEINREIVRARTQINSEIAIEQARLAQNNKQFAFKQSTEYLGQDKALFNNIYNRALQAAIATTDGILKVYQAKMQGYISQIEAKRTEAEAYKSYADAQNAINVANTEVYKARISAYQAQLTTELAIIENIGKVYAFQMQGYEAQARVSAAQVDAEIKRFQAMVGQEGIIAEIGLKEAQLILERYMSQMRVTLEQIQGGSNIAAQIAASALAGVSVTASIGDSSSRSDNVSYSYGQSISNSANLSEVHTYDETGG